MVSIRTYLITIKRIVHDIDTRRGTIIGLLEYLQASPGAVVDNVILYHTLTSEPVNVPLVEHNAFAVTRVARWIVDVRDRVVVVEENVRSGLGV